MSESNYKIKIVVINGSGRPGNYTGKALNIVMDELSKHPEISAQLINSGELLLPLPGVNPNSESSKKLKEDVKNAVGVILATPEYHGSFSSLMKLTIENLGFPSVLSGKPVGLVGVAAGAIGAIKSLEQLRGVCSHIGAIVLPLSISVANVQNVFDEKGNCLDPNIDKLLRRAPEQLLNYINQNLCPAVTLERLLREGNKILAD